MAMVHPSRMGLVPQDPRDRDRDRERGRGLDRDSERGREFRDYSPRDRSRDRGRSRSRSRGHDEKRRSRSPPRNERRASPEYDDYRRPAVPPPRKYPEGGYRSGYHGSGDLESRRLERESRIADVWPPSPKARTRSISPERHKHKKSKRSHSSSSDDSSEEERRRREKKERKRARREKKEKRRKYYSENEESDRERDRRRSRRERSLSRDGRARTPPRSTTPEGEEDQWVVKSSSTVPSAPQVGTSHSYEGQEDMDDEDEELGPQPMVKLNAPKKVDERAYGGSLLRGEGSAMAAFLQEGTETRIPRRGEIGLTSGEIAAYENVGYVMSGSRHKRMNAVRMRKENQVISAEEKRGILKLQKEERERREAILREEFSEMVHERLRGTEGGSSQAK